MRDYFKAKTWFITILMFIIAFGLSSAIVYYELGFRQNVKTISASASNNVNGWAWSSNIGWVSFNCTNDSPACVNSNYGVSIDLNTGDFSGYAWSSSVGWIDFAPAGPYPEAPLNSAHYDPATGNITGWAKIITMGADGWLKMSGTWTSGVSIDLTTGDFRGWAWNANNDGSGIGWVSFNCSNDAPACGSSNYKVVADISRSPSATALTAPNWSFSEAAQYGALKAKLGWTFSDPDLGQSEYAYQIIVNTSNSIINPVFDSGQCLGYNNPTNKCVIDIGVDQFPLHSAMTLNYNTPYYWWVKVWDNSATHKDSTLAQYNSAQDAPLEADDGSPLTFTVYRHEMPDVSFIYFPVSPSRGEEIKFTDTSKIYLTSAPTTPVNCTDALCNWTWSATAGATFKDNDMATPSPTITFNSAGNSTVTLTVTDSDGYSAFYQVVININSQLPKWKEVKPE